ncbi:alpha/beta fold hydrolase [Streptomyces sp. 71268]|uniref:alpha/beta fold hydrolase n=1 Tax=Streptomyces sp. 71268 TaxID=3002640 RepID=UPI0023F82609|nr:alpha/beta fold hydrolase [Streptomyces sp. 71268]WEV28938.1 alpha/beta fold hydrolase [Streptomyces sp. 71268]
MPEPVVLAADTPGPHLVCLPSVLAASGPHQFARFAAALRADCRVSALPLPGFRPGEPLPASLDALLDALAGAVRSAVGDEPFAMAGYSSGGLLAHAVAERVGARAVVLLDSRPLDAYRAADSERLLAGLATRADYLDDTRLTAMGGYLRLLAGASLRPHSRPTLLVTAAEREAEPLAPWPLPHTEVSAPGDHFTLIEEHAETTAKAVGAWLGELGQLA